MSRFGIRKRLKSRLGIGRPERSIVSYRVTYVLPDGSEQVVEAEERYSLLMASQALPAPISTGRRAGAPAGWALRPCRIEVLNATRLTPMSDAERTRADARGRQAPRRAGSGAGARHHGGRATGVPHQDHRARRKVRVAALFDYDSVRGIQTATDAGRVTRPRMDASLSDLHIHVGASVAPHILWEMAHQQGFKLPVGDYFEFVDLVTVNPRKVRRSRTT